MKRILTLRLALAALPCSHPRPSAPTASKSAFGIKLYGLQRRSKRQRHRRRVGQLHQHTEAKTRPKSTSSCATTASPNTYDRHRQVHAVRADPAHAAQRTDRAAVERRNAADSAAFLAWSGPTERFRSNGRGSRTQLVGAADPRHRRGHLRRTRLRLAGRDDRRDRDSVRRVRVRRRRVRHRRRGSRRAVARTLVAVLAGRHRRHRRSPRSRTSNPRHRVRALFHDRGLGVSHRHPGNRRRHPTAQADRERNLADPRRHPLAALRRAHDLAAARRCASRSFG